jgi:phosphohistidine swiveling domain-containing protein
MNQRTFEAPGPGSWELDTTHFQKPVTLYSSGITPDQFVRGFKIGTERYGLLLSHLQPAYVHGFLYMKPMLTMAPEDAPPGPPPDGFFDQAELVARIDKGVKAIKGKIWREDLKHWDEEVKPDSIRRNRALQSVSPETLSDDELITHLIECRDNIAEMWLRHHIFTIPSVLPVGLYLSSVCGWADISPGDALGLLKGSSPVSTGIAASELKTLAALIKQNSIKAEQFGASSSKEVLQALRSMPDPIGPAVERYLDIVSYQLTSGYDITERYALEMPELLVANIWSEVARLDVQEEEDDFDKRRLAIRNKVPPEHQVDFDTLLEEARLINRLRDERGVYNEAKAVGLARRALLEAGKRLVAKERLSKASTFLHASHEEMLALLRDEHGPSEAELLEREEWYLNNTNDDAPPFLGSPPEAPPPLEALPENARLAEGAIGAAIGNIFDSPEANIDTGETITGLPVSQGSYEGTACIIRSPADFQRLQQGDVLITKNTSAAFNIVLPMLGALVTDRGGQLSHAAIIAREYGIPGIVSTRNATRMVPDGARVRVDGATGILEVIS